MPRSLHSIGFLPEVSLELEVYSDDRKVQQALDLIQRMPEVQRKAFDKACKNFANMLARYVRRCIQTNTPPPGVSWPPHSQDYLKKYDPKGFWQLSSQVLRSIRARYYQNSWYVGPNPGEKAVDPVNRAGRSRPSTLTLIELVRIQELGTEGKSNSKYHNDIPPRPLFKPSFKAVGGTERLKRYLIDNLRKEIKKTL